MSDTETAFHSLPLHVIISRLFQIGLALIPAFTGIFALLNNIQGMNDTLTHVLQPLFAMQNVSPEFLHSWRAIHSEGIVKGAYFFMMSGETLVGILAIISIIKMVIGFRESHHEFNRDQAWARAACVLGFLVWGLGFYTIAGDYFLAWQTQNLADLQSSGLHYVLMMAIPYFFLKMHEVSSTV